MSSSQRDGNSELVFFKYTRTLRLIYAWALDTFEKRHSTEIMYFFGVAGVDWVVFERRHGDCRFHFLIVILVCNITAT